MIKQEILSSRINDVKKRISEELQKEPKQMDKEESQ